MTDEQETSKVPLLLGGVALLAVVGALAWFLASRSAPAQVSGTVTLDNAPLPGAQVVFLGEDEKNQAPIVAQTGDTGNYKLIPNSAAGILPGKYKVVVLRMTLKDGTLPPREKLEQARNQGLLSNNLPAIYEDRSTTPLQFDLRAGDNTIDLKLKKKS